MENLETLREHIDKIDCQLIALFEQRMDTVIHVAEYKLQNNLPVLNTGREQQVLDKCVSMLNNKSYSDSVISWMQATMALSRATQEAYLESQKNN